MRIVIRYAERDLMGIGLTNNVRPCILDLLHHKGILHGDIIRKEFRAACAADAFCIVQVFNCNGYTVKRFAIQ